MNPERQPHSRETAGVEVQQAAEAQAERLKTKHERGGEHADDQVERVSRARHEAKEVFSREAGKEQRGGGEPTARAVRRVTARQKQAGYQKTMKQIRSEMNPAQRSFSKLIHSPLIEKTSDVVGGTVARPNALLAGSLSAFVLVTAVYVLARHYGYPLSGSETITAFIVGWLLGLVYDYLRLVIAGKR